jgi:hypothetical protein
VRILRQRIFVVHAWGDSQAGKTATLKAALSCWGDPEKLMVNFNSTQVALERMAGFFNDLPMGIDERQLAGQGQEQVEKIVYMLASGTGRARGSKTGGLQSLRTWRGIALTTGEEPLSTETSKSGVASRTIEIFGAGFNSSQEAGDMHRTAGAHFGWAGDDFVTRLLGTDEESIRGWYNDVLGQVTFLGEGADGSHLASIALVTLADMMAQEWIFRDDPPKAPAEGEGAKLEIGYDAMERAVNMAVSILAEQRQNQPGDVNENATQFVVDWILSNMASFNAKATPCYGDVEDGRAYIYPSVLNQALTRAGYSPRKTMKYLGDKGIVTVTKEASGKQLYSVTKRIYGKLARVVDFDLSQFAKRVPEEPPQGQDFRKAKPEDDVPFPDVTPSN